MIAAGLVVETLTLGWSHATAFVVFLTIGAGLVGLGVLVYLYAILGDLL